MNSAGPGGQSSLGPLPLQYPAEQQWPRWAAHLKSTMRLAGSWLESLGYSIPAAPNPLTRRSGTTRRRWAAPMEVTAGRRRRSLLPPAFVLTIPTGVLVGAVADCALMLISILQAACNAKSFAGRGRWGYGIGPVVYGMPVGGVVALVPGLGAPTGPPPSSLPRVATEKGCLL